MLRQRLCSVAIFALVAASSVYSFASLFDFLPKIAQQPSVSPKEEWETVPEVGGMFYAGARIAILDKDLGKALPDFTLAVEHSYKHKEIKITLLKCWQSCNLVTGSDAKALFVIEDLSQANASRQFWFTAKSPGFSKWQHQRFSIILKQCSGDAVEPSSLKLVKQLH